MSADCNEIIAQELSAVFNAVAICVKNNSTTIITITGAKRIAMPIAPASRGRDLISTVYGGIPGAARLQASALASLNILDGT